MKSLCILFAILVCMNMKISNITISLENNFDSDEICVSEYFDFKLELKYTGVKEGAWLTAICGADIDPDGFYQIQDTPMKVVKFMVQYSGGAIQTIVDDISGGSDPQVMDFTTGTYYKRTNRFSFASSPQYSYSSLTIDDTNYPYLSIVMKYEVDYTSSIITSRDLSDIGIPKEWRCWISDFVDDIQPRRISYDEEEETETEIFDEEESSEYDYSYYPWYTGLEGFVDTKAEGIKVNFHDNLANYAFWTVDRIHSDILQNSTVNLSEGTCDFLEETTERITVYEDKIMELQWKVDQIRLDIARAERSTRVVSSSLSNFEDYEDAVEDLQEAIEDYCEASYEAAEDMPCREDVYEAYEAFEALKDEDTYRGNCNVIIPTPIEYDYARVEDVEDFVQEKMGAYWGDWSRCYRAEQWIGTKYEINIYGQKRGNDRWTRRRL